MDFATGFAAGFAMAKKKFEGGGGGEEEWTPPADWPIVPEPSDYEMYFLIETLTTSQTVYFTVTDPATANTGVGNLSIDWGDGTVVSYANGEWSNRESYHSYAEIGKYVVKIYTTSTSCFFQSASPNNALLIVKLGEEIVINNGSDSHTQRAFYSQSRLQYIKLSGKGGLARSDTFYGNYILQKVDISIPPTVIPPNTFTYTDSLRKFDFSEVITIETAGITYSGFEKIFMPKCVSVKDRGLASNELLREVDLPLCTFIDKGGLNLNYKMRKVNLPLCMSMGNSAMSSNRTLTQLTIADNCKFGTNCFASCYNLNPHPDGSTN